MLFYKYLNYQLFSFDDQLQLLARAIFGSESKTARNV